MKGKRRGVQLLIILLALLFSAGCGERNIKSTAGYNENISAEGCPTGVVAENDRFQLMWDDEAGCLILYDATDDAVYSSTPYDFYASGEKEGVAAIELYSLLKVTYIDAETGALREVDSYTASVQENGAFSEASEDGVRMIYSFPRTRFSVAVDMTLCEDGLQVSLPMSEIREEENLIYEISVLPYLASAKNDADSYLFVPSGSGALIYTENRSATTNYDESVYGDDLCEPVTMLKYNSRQIYLPVFGVKDGDTGMIGVIEEGADCAHVRASAGNADVGYSGVYASFRIRGKEEINYDTVNSVSTMAMKYSQTTANYQQLTVKYLPVKNDVTYMGMAAAYRDYLGLGKEDKAAPALSVSFLGSTRVEKSFFGIPYESDVATTTLSQAISISEELNQLTGGDPLLIHLIGYGKGGLANLQIGGGFTLSKQLGTPDELSSLQALAEKSGGLLAMDYELIRFQKGGGGYSVFGSSAYRISSLKATLYEYRRNTMVNLEKGHRWYLTARKDLPSTMEKVLSSVSKYRLNAASFSSLTHSVYSDYRDAQYTVASQMSEDASAMLAKCTETGVTVVAAEPNLYAALAADYILETPSDSSHFNVLDFTIPFYSLVFQGQKALTSPSINLASDPRLTFLRAVATGMTLQFTLCDTVYPSLRSSKDTAYVSSLYSGWKSDIFDMYREYEDLYAQTKGQKIVAYSIKDGLSCTGFENGTEVYVNYTDRPVSSPLGTVAAKSFVFR